MTKDIDKNQQFLVELLNGIPSCLLAFSGGLDSVFLAVMAKANIAGRVLCITVVDSSTPTSDLRSAKEVAKHYGLEHVIINSEIHSSVRSNPIERCYYCKKQLFGLLEEIRVTEKLAAILDGENASDCMDYRPGSKAARECGVLSPLADSGLSKDDIRVLAKEMGIKVWDRPQSACLSSRVPFGTALDDMILKRVDCTEDFIRSKGIRLIRARVEKSGVRLELGQAENNEDNWTILRSLESEIKQLGWEAVTIDPSGYVPAGLREKK